MFLGYRKFKDTFQALAFVGVWLHSTSFIIIIKSWYTAINRDKETEMTSYALHISRPLICIFSLRTLPFLSF